MTRLEKESIVQVIAVLVLSYALAWCVCKVCASQNQSITRAHAALRSR
jgi:hypothetical protein